MGEVITQQKLDIAWVDTQRASHIRKNCLFFVLVDIERLIELNRDIQRL